MVRIIGAEYNTAECLSAAALHDWRIPIRETEFDLMCCAVCHRAICHIYSSCFRIPRPEESTPPLIHSWVYDHGDIVDDVTRSLLLPNYYAYQTAKCKYCGVFLKDSIETIIYYDSSNICNPKPLFRSQSC